MEAPDSALDAREIQKRSSRFAALRSAQRALSDLAHPAELEDAIEQGRKILIELQALSIRATEAGASAPSAEQTAHDLAAVRSVDQMLDALSEKTRELFDQKPIAQLRTSLRGRAGRHPDEIRALIGVVLEGEVERDKDLRFLEYLVTLLSSEECDSGRAVVREPAEVAPQIPAFASQRFDANDPRCLEAERVITQATEKLFDAAAIGSTRDQIRQYKKELGARILHPRVLSAAVRYNVAMSNRVDGLVEGSRNIDRLADDMVSPPAAPAKPASSASLFDSTDFARIVSALQARVRGGASSDALAASVVSHFEISGLEPFAIEAFEAEGDDHAAFLVRAAVALGLVIRFEARVGDLLQRFSFDPAVLSGSWLHELAQEMTATTRKLMAEARYPEASRLSEMKVKHLAVVSSSPSHRGGARRKAEGGVPRVETPAKSLPLDMTWLRPIGLGVGLLALVLLLSPLRGGDRAPVADELAHLSPYLQSGYEAEEGGVNRFIGRLTPSWAYLQTSDRVSAATEIGEGLRRQGVETVLLVDQRDVVQVRYEDGKLLHLEPKGR